MARIGKIISTNIEEEFRKIFTEYHTNYTDESIQLLPPGIDSSPIVGDQGVSIIIDGNAGKTVQIGVYPDPLADEGEIRIYSRDDNGVQKAEIFLKKDGSIEITAETKIIVDATSIEILGDTDNAVRFTKLKEVIDEMQSDIGDLKTVFSTTWIVVPADGGAALKTAAATWAGAPLAKNIDDSKVDEVKLS